VMHQQLQLSGLLRIWRPWERESWFRGKRTTQWRSKKMEECSNLSWRTTTTTQQHRPETKKLIVGEKTSSVFSKRAPVSFLLLRLVETSADAWRIFAARFYITGDLQQHDKRPALLCLVCENMYCIIVDNKLTKSRGSSLYTA